MMISSKLVSGLLLNDYPFNAVQILMKLQQISPPMHRCSQNIG
jgi:hypothetical protein